MASIDGTIVIWAFSLIFILENRTDRIQVGRAGGAYTDADKSTILRFRESVGLVGIFAGMSLFALVYHSEFVGMSGNVTIAEASPAAFGSVAQSQGEVTAFAKIKNISGRPFRLIGGGRSCRCVSANFELREVLPGESLTIPIKINLQKVRVGQTRQRLIYYLDSPFQRSVLVDIEGEVL